MPYLTKFGVQHGLVPRVTGNIYFVAPSASYTLVGPQGQRAYTASDGNDGLSPERALLTIARALALVSANVGDVILLLEGTHTVTATINVSTAGVTILGSGAAHSTHNPYAPKSIVTSTGTSVPLFNITASNTRLGYLDLRPTTAYSAITFQTLSALDGIHIHDCHFDMETPAVSVGTIGIDLGYRAATANLTGLSDGKQGNTTTAITSVLVENCVFEADGAQGAAINWATAYGAVRNCNFWLSAGTWATVFRVATSSDNLLIDNCVFTSSGTMTVSIDGTFADQAGGCVISRCYFGGFGTSNVNSVDAIRGFGSGEVQVLDSFAGSIANGTNSSTSIARMIG